MVAGQAALQTLAGVRVTATLSTLATTLRAARPVPALAAHCRRRLYQRMALLAHPVHTSSHTLQQEAVSEHRAAGTPGTHTLVTHCKRRLCKRRQPLAHPVHTSSLTLQQEAAEITEKEMLKCYGRPHLLFSRMRSTVRVRARIPTANTEVTSPFRIE